MQIFFKHLKYIFHHILHVENCFISKNYFPSYAFNKKTQEQFDRRFATSFGLLFD